MNQFLNDALTKTFKPGRVRMDYKHIRETDSFHTLSAYGLQALPESLQRRSDKGRPPRLRVTTDNKTGNVIARIVKIPIAHLHIFNPGSPYDCRISVNLEVNLNRKSHRMP